MPADSETQRGSWLIYATAFSIALPVLYVLSSGPAQCIERTEAGSYTLGALFTKDDLSIPYRQGSFVMYRWTPPINMLFLPLECVPRNSGPAKTLNWYWNLFGAHWHYGG